MSQPTRVRLDFDSVSLSARLRDTPTARAIATALPLEAGVSTWGKEVFFPAPVEAEREADAREVVTAGEIAFWCEGRFVAIGFGPTPASTGDEIRLAAPTNIFADIDDGDPADLAAVTSGSRVRMTAAD